MTQAAEIDHDIVGSCAAWEECRTRVLPANWRTLRTGPNGASYRSTAGLQVICSVCRELDGRRWLHVSVSRPSRLPDWHDLRAVKNTFVGRDRKAIQVLPAQAEYVNLHPYVLHLWCCLDGDVLPDFRKDGAI